MSVSAELYIVISLMFAVFAAVAAVGTSVVLGAGFERLRSGFEIIKKQTGFFANAIHELDKKTDQLSDEQKKLTNAVSSMAGRVERTEKQTGFFTDAIQDLEMKIQQQAELGINPLEKPVDLETPEEKPRADHFDGITASAEDAETANADSLLHNVHFLMPQQPEEPAAVKEECIPDEMPDIAVGQASQSPSGFTKILSQYFQSERRQDAGPAVTYH